MPTVQAHAHDCASVNDAGTGPAVLHPTVAHSRTRSADELMQNPLRPNASRNSIVRYIPMRPITEPSGEPQNAPEWPVTA